MILKNFYNKKISFSEIVRSFLFLIFCIFLKFDVNNYDNVETSTLEWWFTSIPILFFIFSLITLFYIFLNLDFIFIFSFLPVLYTNSFELYNRFYIVIILGLLASKVKSNNIKTLVHFYLITLQPINVFFLYLKNRKFYLITCAVVILVFIFSFSLDNESILHIISYSSKKSSIENILLNNQVLEHEIGNFSFDDSSYQRLYYLILPIVFFNSFLGALTFQVIPIVLFLKEKYLFVLLISMFLLYSLFTPNLASFYRNFIPFAIVYLLIVKKREQST